MSPCCTALLSPHGTKFPSPSSTPSPRLLTCTLPSSLLVTLVLTPPGCRPSLHSQRLDGPAAGFGAAVQHGGLRQMVNKAFNRRSGVTPASGGPLSGALPPKGPLPAPPVRPTPPLPPSPQSPPPSVTPSVGRLDPSTDSAFGVKFVSAEHLSCKEWHERPFPLRRGVTTGESFVAECDPYWQRRLL